MTKSIVFVHGLGLGEWIFKENFVPYYQSAGYQVHTFDLPGHTNRSSSLDKLRVSLDSCVSFVEQYLLQNIAGPYVVVGMSMGGAICQKLIEKNYKSDKLVGVVLLSSVPPTSNLKFTLRLCKNLAAKAPDVLIDFFNEKTNSKLMMSPYTLDQFSENTVNQYMSRIITGFSQLEYAIFFQDLVSSSFKFDIPLKLITGKDDMLFSEEVARFTSSWYSKDLEVIPDIGHLIPIEANYLKGIHAIDSFLHEVF